MIKILKETFAILNKNLWLLFLFMTISYVGLTYFIILRNFADSMLQISIGLITLLFIAVAGVAGFFHALRSTIDAEYSTEERSRFELLKTFSKGVSEYIFSAFGIIILYIIISSVAFGLALVIGKNLIGLFSFSPEAFANAMTSPETLNEFMKNITPEDMFKLSKWHLLYLAMSSILAFLLLYWLPETFYKTKNSVLSLFYAVKKVVLNLLATLQLFLTITLVNIGFSLIMGVLTPFPIMRFLVYFLYFYGLLYVFLLSFNFYRAKFIVNELPVLVEEEEKEKENEQDSDGEKE